MISIDIETTGLDPVLHAIASIGAVDVEQPYGEPFYVECQVKTRVQCEKERRGGPLTIPYLTPESLEVNGFTEEQLTDPTKPTVQEAVQALIDWVRTKSTFGLFGHNIHFDYEFLRTTCRRSGLKPPWNHRLRDLHSSCAMHMELNGKNPPLEDGNSTLNLDKVLQYCFLRAEPTPHNALTGARLATEAYWFLRAGKRTFDQSVLYGPTDRQAPRFAREIRGRS